MIWKCLVCEKTRPPQFLRSRTWSGICMSCDDKVNDVVARVLKLRPAVCPAFTLKRDS